VTLLALATRVADLSTSCKDWERRAEEVGRLATRRDQLRIIADRVSSLTTVADVLCKEPTLLSRLVQVKVVARRLSIRANDLAHRLEMSSEAVLKPKALDIFEGGALDDIERHLTSAWRDFLGTGDRPGIETVLGRFAALRDVVARITQRRRQLQTLALTLPTTSACIIEGRVVKTELANELSALAGSGLDDDVVEFLRQSVEGVPLSALLANDKILVWLADHGLTDYFRVRSN
jgi:hypothetical protein